VGRPRLRDDLPSRVRRYVPADSGGSVTQRSAQGSRATRRVSRDTQPEGGRLACFRVGRLGWLLVGRIVWLGAVDDLSQ
jgi:hypothetical protein